MSCAAARRSKDLASAALLFLAARGEGGIPPGCRRHARVSVRLCGRLVLVADGHGDGHVKDLLDAVLLLTTALHVQGTHLLGNNLALVGGDGGEALRLEQFYAVLLVTEIRLEAKEHQRGCGAEVEDLWVPLGTLA